MVNVTSLSPLVEKSFSFQVTSVPSAFVVPTILAELVATFAFGSKKVQVGITFQFVKGSGNIPVGLPSTSRISFSFSSWPKSNLNRPAYDRTANCELTAAIATANSTQLIIFIIPVFIELIGICFFDTTRFRENSLSSGFTQGLCDLPFPVSSADFSLFARIARIWRGCAQRRSGGRLGAGLPAQNRLARAGAGQTPPA